MDGGRGILPTPFNPRKDTKSSDDHLLFDEFQYVDENTVGDDGGDDVAVTQGVIPGGVVCVHDHTHDLRGQYRQHHGDVKLHPYLGHPSVYKSNINIMSFPYSKTTCSYEIQHKHCVLKYSWFVCKWHLLSRWAKSEQDISSSVSC